MLIFHYFLSNLEGREKEREEESERGRERERERDGERERERFEKIWLSVSTLVISKAYTVTIV